MSHDVNGSSLVEVRELAGAIYAESACMDWETALDEARAQLPALEQFAEQWDAAAGPESMPPASSAPAAELVYLPDELEPHVQRAVDKAIYQRAAGVVARQVGRFWFVPSRTEGGTIYRVTSDSCTCEAFQHGRLCWHRALIAIEREQAA
jgi:hypothetical protein